MDQSEIDDRIEAAKRAVTFAQNVRALHRRRTPKGSTARETDITVALDRLKAAMKPLRSHIAQFPYLLNTAIAEESRAEIREVSKALQAERRKLFKMRKSK